MHNTNLPHEKKHLDSNANWDIDHIIFTDNIQSVITTGISGDELADIMKTGKGQIVYWLTPGYYSLATKVTQNKYPLFDHSDSFNVKSIKLTDIIWPGKD